MKAIQEKTRILLHSCCAPCSAAIIEWLLGNGYEPVIFFYNPNIYPEEEYIKRKNELIRYAGELGLEYHDSDADWAGEHRKWNGCACAYKYEPERGKRCMECFRYRMEAAAAYAQKCNIPYFTTSLSSSRWKSQDQIFQAAREAEARHPGTTFFDKNWRKGGLYERRNELARQFYNQKYCGCEYSMPDSLTTLKLKFRRIAATSDPHTTSRFFKNGSGEYSGSDIFAGIRVPELRAIAEGHYTLPLEDIRELLHEPIHELRQTALIILVHQFGHDKDRRKEILDFYLDNLSGVNNWDLVDMSSHKILGAYTLDHPETVETMFRLFRSDDLWEKRTGLVANWALIRKGKTDTLYEMTDELLEDIARKGIPPHDLIQKAAGWMLREAGKKDTPRLVSYLKKNIANIPRTTFRYAIERLTEEERGQI